MTDQAREKIPWAVLHGITVLFIAMVAYWSTRLENRVDQLEQVRIDKARAEAALEIEMRHLSNRTLEIRDDVKKFAERFASIERTLMEMSARDDREERSQQ